MIITIHPNVEDPTPQTSNNSPRSSPKLPNHPLVTHQSIRSSSIVTLSSPSQPSNTVDFNCNSACFHSLLLTFSASELKLLCSNSSSFALISSSSGEKWEKDLEEGEMQIITPSKTQIALFASRTPNQGTTTSKSLPKFVFNPHPPQSFLWVPQRCSSTTTAARFGTTVQHKEQEEEEEDGMDGVLVVRRPLKGEILEDGGEDEGQKDEILGSSGGSELRKGGISEKSLIVEEKVGDLDEVAGLDKELSGFAKKLPMFEPLERVSAMKPVQTPLQVNLELWLYRAKVLGRKFMFSEAEKLLRKCIFFWPEDGRAYVALGKNLSKQSKYSEARIVYETGCQATQGENPFIWQCWAVLENKIGNVRRARELFDAATVADEKHVATWHGWAVLEIKQGNITKARNLLGKGLKCCGGNEYIFQTLAMLEVKANRIEQARYLFQRATSCNPKSCASWLAWAQLEMHQENSQLARKLFEKAVQASPKNRFAWHVWALFETNQGDTDKGRKLLKIGHKLNPRDPVLLQSLALLEYKHTSANLARVLFRRASKIDPQHQPIWMAWGWMEWKEGNISTAKDLYQKAVSIDSTTETAARCLQAWGVLEQRLGNLSAARRFFRSSLNINSQSYITWMTWASFEEEQGNAVRAEEIRNLYFQQRTEVVDNASWVMGFLDIIDPAVVSIKRLLSIDQKSETEVQETTGGRTEEMGDVSISEFNEGDVERKVKDGEHSSSIEESEDKMLLPASDFDLDSFVRDKLSLDVSQLDVMGEISSSKKNISSKKIWKSQSKTSPTQA